MATCVYRSGGRLERVVRPTLSHGLCAGKSEEVVAPQLAAADAGGKPPESPIGAGTDPAACRLVCVMVGRGQRALL